jgi:hypothetical protein
VLSLSQTDAIVENSPPGFKRALRTPARGNEVWAWEVYESAPEGRLEGYFKHLVAIHAAPEPVLVGSLRQPAREPPDAQVPASWARPSGTARRTSICKLDKLSILRI